MPFGCPWNCCPVPLGISIITASLPIRPIRTGIRHLERHLVEAETGIELGRWNLTEESVRQYLESVGDDLDLYFNLGLVPPLALCAYALGALLEKLSLPPGTIHSIQEMDALLPVSIGAEIHGMAVLERPRRRVICSLPPWLIRCRTAGAQRCRPAKLRCWFRWAARKVCRLSESL